MEQETNFMKSVIAALLIVLIALSGVFIYEEVSQHRREASYIELDIEPSRYSAIEVSYDVITLDDAEICGIDGTIMFNNDSITENYSRSVVYTAIRRNFGAKNSREINDSVYNKILLDISEYVIGVDSNIMFYPRYRKQ